ncbi:MAG: virulence factor family protein [Verrucomicrobiaceae bacterium]|nr:virulence factor family protein [Verrucomicrobiaceae bacterium]
MAVPAGDNEDAGALPVSAWQRLRTRLNASSVLHSMIQGFMTVAGLTLLAKAVAFFKEADVARRFGISDALDAFGLAFGAHAFASGMLGGGIPSTFLPAYARLQHLHGPGRAERLALQSAISHGFLLLLAGGLIYAAGPQLVDFLGHGFPLEKKALALRLMRGLLPFMFCYGMSMHLSMWLRGNKRFAVATATPVLIPAAILVAMAVAGKGISVDTLVWGTNIGAMLHLLALAIVLGRLMPGEAGWLGGCFRRVEPQNRRVLASALPSVISGLVLGGAPIVDQAMAARLASGSVTVLSYSDKVCSIVLALTASAAAETLAPFFADVVARRNWPSLKRQLLHTIGVILAVAVPLVALLFWQAPLVVRLLYQRASFGPEDTARVAAVLRCASLQIPFYIASLIMSRVVIALQGSWFTLVTAVISLTGNIIFNFIFMRWYGVAGIALSTAMVYAVSTLMLTLYLLRSIARLTREDLQGTPASSLGS